MNKYIKIARYEMTTIGFAIGIFYLVMIAITTLVDTGFTIAVYDGERQSEAVMGFEIIFSTLIFLGITGSLGFLEDFKFLMQNCFTRREIFTSQLLFFITVSVTMSAVNLLLLSLSEQGILGFTSTFHYMYGGSLNLFTEMVLMIVTSLCIATFFYAMTILFYRFDKRKVGIILALCIVGIIAFVTVMARNLQGETLVEIGEFLIGLMGFIDNGVNLLNPILTFLVITLINSTAAWLLIRRAELRQ